MPQKHLFLFYFVLDVWTGLGAGPDPPREGAILGNSFRPIVWYTKYLTCAISPPVLFASISPFLALLLTFHPSPPCFC